MECGVRIYSSKRDVNNIMKQIRFAVFADLHIDITPIALDYFKQFVKDLATQKTDFVIQLGDPVVARPWIEEYYKDPASFVMPEEWAKESKNLEYHKEYYQHFLEMKNALPDLYSVLGNHDHDRADKQYLMKSLSMPAPYYCFTVNGFDLIALDSNNYYVGDEFIPYDRQNYMKDKREGKKLDALGAEQLEWLRKTLAANDHPAILFAHAPMDTGIAEREEFAAILREAKAAGKKIIMCANGHSHIDSLNVVDGIHYWEVNGMTYRFLSRQLEPAHYFGEELSARYLNIRFGAPYTAPLYAYVTVREDGYVKIEGKTAEYMHPTPEERGFVEHNPKAGGPEIKSHEFYAD